MRGASILLCSLLAHAFVVQFVWAEPPDVGHVYGVVLDAKTGTPVVQVQVLLEEAGRSAQSAEDGTFEIHNIPAGDYTLRTYRIGYLPLMSRLAVRPGDTTHVALRIQTIVLEAGELLVEGEGDRGASEGTSFSLEGRALRGHLGTTIAETMEDEPGLATRSMGPAPARPVLRGLGGERLLVLEDGERTGDLSETSSDHILLIDPLTAERIEVVRGPTALEYGSGVLGGVVNVVRGLVPAVLPERLRMTGSAQAQTVNAGVASVLGLEAPVGKWIAVRGDLSMRRARDVRTPVGVLGNSDMQATGGSLGASIVRRNGLIGFAAGRNQTDYGIPGGFVGAHPGGVDVVVHRDFVEARGEWHPGLKRVPAISANTSYARYHHREYEDSGALGVEYGLVSFAGVIKAETSAPGDRAHGAVGLTITYRDYATGGFSFTPPAIERTWALFGHRDLHVGRFSVQAGMRYEQRSVKPTGATGGAEAPPSRTFSGLAASVAIEWHPFEELTVGMMGMRSARAPGVEELYSEGPHLAAYTFETGNPDLSLERGLGYEAFGRMTGKRVQWRLAVFRNAINDFIFPRNTGQVNHRVFLPIYQYAGSKAVFVGAEGRLELLPLRGWRVEGTGSYVRGDLTDVGHPIPWIPPLQGSIEICWERGRLTMGSTLRLAASQERTAEFEEPTEGYAAVDLHAQYHLDALGGLHTVDLGILNLTNAKYRDHLSRVKSVMPEPGLNVRLTYRAYL